jgi:hypothetical protein
VRNIIFVVSGLKIMSEAYLDNNLELFCRVYKISAAIYGDHNILKYFKKTFATLQYITQGSKIKLEQITE